MKSNGLRQNTDSFLSVPSEYPTLQTENENRTSNVTETEPVDESKKFLQRQKSNDNMENYYF